MNLYQCISLNKANDKHILICKDIEVAQRLFACPTCAIQKSKKCLGLKEVNPEILGADDR